VRLWEEWRHLTEEKEKKLLATWRDSNDEDEDEQENYPYIPSKIRKNLKKYIGSPFLECLDAELRLFVQLSDSGCYSLSIDHQIVSDLYSISVSKSQVLRFVFKDSYYRLLFHGICSFYSLHSTSHTSKNGERITTVLRNRGVVPNISLSNYLLAPHRHHRPRYKKTQRSAHH